MCTHSHEIVEFSQSDQTGQNIIRSLILGQQLFGCVAFLTFLIGKNKIRSELAFGMNGGAR